MVDPVIPLTNASFAFLYSLVMEIERETNKDKQLITSPITWDSIQTSMSFSSCTVGSHGRYNFLSYSIDSRHYEGC